MERSNRWILVVLIMGSLALSSCYEGEPSAKVGKSEPARIEHLDGTDLSRVILTARAAERLGIKTAPVRAVRVARKRVAASEVVALQTASGVVRASSVSADVTPVALDGAEHGLVPGQALQVEHPLPTTERKVVPYAAVIYGAHGDTWVYASPESLSFVRHRIIVDYIDGDLAVLSEGPPSGTAVVTVAVAELYGAEHEIGH